MFVTAGTDCFLFCICGCICGAGIHLEGPFIATGGGLGAHPADCVRVPDPDYLAELCMLANDKVLLVTLSAEAEGAAQSIPCMPMFRQSIAPNTIKFNQSH